MTKKIIVLAVGILLFNFCFSQENDTVKYKRLVKFPVLTIDNYNNPSSDFTANIKNASIGTNEFITQLSFAIPVKKQKTYLFNSFKYTNSTYQSSINGSESLSTNVYTFRYIFGLIQALPERWRLTIDIVPNICADFKEPIGNEDFIFYGAVLAMKRVGPNREYGFGLAYASYVSLFEGPFIIPIYTLIKKKGKLTTRMILPTYFQQLYELNKNTQVGYRIDIDGNFHNVLYNKELAEFDLNAISNIKLTAGPYIQRKLFGDLYLNGKIGIIPVNYFSVLDDKRDKELSFFTGSNIYAKFGLSLLK